MVRITIRAKRRCAPSFKHFLSIFFRVMKKDKKGQKGQAMFCCEVCDFYSNHKAKFERHLNTKKHNDNKMITNDNKKGPFLCDCGKSYKFQSGLSRHMMVCKKQANTDKILTNTDKILTNTDINSYNKPDDKQFTCPCGKAYNHRQSLHTHKKACSFQQDNPEAETGQLSAAVSVESDSNLEDKFQKRLVKTLKELLPQMTPTNITNNNRISNNQISIFLHEKCADAMSIQQFAKQLTFSIDDVLMKKHDALVKVINQNLKPMAVTERPVHCTNVARRKWHVKDETEGWKKDDGGLLLRKVNDSLLRKSPAQYADAFPEFITQPKRQDEYVEIVRMTSTDLEPKAEARVLTSVGEANQLDMNN